MMSDDSVEFLTGLPDRQRSAEGILEQLIAGWVADMQCMQQKHREEIERMFQKHQSRLRGAVLKKDGDCVVSPARSKIGAEILADCPPGEVEEIPLREVARCGFVGNVHEPDVGTKSDSRLPLPLDMPHIGWEAIGRSVAQAARSRPLAPTDFSKTQMVRQTSAEGAIDDGPNTNVADLLSGQKGSVLVGRDASTEDRLRRLVTWSKTSSELDIAQWMQQHALLMRPPPGPLDFVHHQLFSFVSAALISLNAVYNGVQLEFMLRKELGHNVGEHKWHVGEVFFTCCFSMELILRVGAGPKYFVLGPEKWWNCFDTVIVIYSIFETILVLLGEHGLDLSSLRTLRLVRIVRILRSAKSIGIVRNLRGLLHTLTTFTDSFAPAMLLLIMVVYIFGLSFMQGFLALLNSSNAADHAGPGVQALEKSFGSMQATAWTLIGMISGGVDWLEVVSHIQDLGTLYMMLIVFYVAFVLFGLMNVLTGVFVNAATQASLLNREIAIDDALSRKQTIKNELIELFLEFDVDQSQSLSWQEFQERFQDERIKAYFMSLDLDMSSVSKIYDVLDQDRSGEVDLQEFVEGCVAFRGTAKAVDICILQNENCYIIDQLQKLREVLLDHRV